MKRCGRIEKYKLNRESSKTLSHYLNQFSNHHSLVYGSAHGLERDSIRSFLLIKATKRNHL
jgi:hypothetical protein